MRASGVHSAGTVAPAEMVPSDAHRLTGAMACLSEGTVALIKQAPWGHGAINGRTLDGYCSTRRAAAGVERGARILVLYHQLRCNTLCSRLLS